MNTKLKLAIAALAMSLIITALARGEEGDGWKMPNLNPFSRKGAPPTSARISDQDDWKMPKLWPTSSRSKSAAKPKSPSAWQKMTTGTKTFMAKTADVLNPFDDTEVKEPARFTGSRNARQAAAKKEERSGSWLPSLWGHNDEDTEPKSVNEFLSRPRPQP